MMPHSLPAAANNATRCYVGMGANLGDRLATLQAAALALKRASGVWVEAASPVYQSEAHTWEPGETQPPYLNAVLALRTTLAPHALLAALHALEADAGRVRRARWAARPLDLDLLLYGALALSTPRLTLPHPRLAERRFVLQPLHDLAPNLILPPPFDAPIADLLAACPDTAALQGLPEPLLPPG